MERPMMTFPKNKLLFGTAGVPQSSPSTTSVNGIRHVSELGLDCMEIEFVQGVKMRPYTAESVKRESLINGVALSVHAPYYVSLNSPKQGIRMMSQERLLKSARIGRICGARSVVFHPGSYSRKPAEEAFKTIRDGLKEVMSVLRSERNPVIMRPETMGKRSQFGTLEEILRLCQEVEGLQPCLDFSHLHARKGQANDYLSFYRILNKVKKKLGDQALKNVHIHISGIMYNEKGEMKHLNLRESDFRYDDWIQALKDFSVEGIVICESPVQEDDAIMLKNLFYGTA
jgi:deoxyribonuclease IV